MRRRTFVGQGSAKANPERTGRRRRRQPASRLRKRAVARTTDSRLEHDARICRAGIAISRLELKGDPNVCSDGPDTSI